MRGVFRFFWLGGLFLWLLFLTFIAGSLLVGVAALAFPSHSIAAFSLAFFFGGGLVSLAAVFWHIWRGLLLRAWQKVKLAQLLGRHGGARSS